MLHAGSKANKRPHGQSTQRVTRKRQAKGRVQVVRTKKATCKWQVSLQQ